MIDHAPEVSAELAAPGLDEEGLSRFSKMNAERAERCAIVFRKALEY